MTLHVLFCSAETLAADGLPLPTASLSLTLDDEVQYRCAGYVQAEIERYAEQLDDGSPATREKGKSDPDSSSDEDDRQPTKAKGKAAAGAEPANGGTSSTSFAIMKVDTLLIILYFSTAAYEVQIEARVRVHERCLRLPASNLRRGHPDPARRRLARPLRPTWFDVRLMHESAGRRTAQ